MSLFAQLMEYALVDNRPFLTAAQAAQYFTLMNLDLLRQAAGPGRKFEPVGDVGKEIQDGFDRAVALLSSSAVTEVDLRDELDFWTRQFEAADPRSVELLEQEGFRLQRET